MRRLLSILRSSQQYCTDNECFGELPDPNIAPPNQNWNMFMLFIGWMFLAMVLFMVRPASLRNQGNEKPRRDHAGGPPPPDVPPVQ